MRSNSLSTIASLRWSTRMPAEPAAKAPKLEPAAKAAPLPQEPKLELELEEKVEPRRPHAHARTAKQ
jgi:hypothetical protein